jgi:tryptophanyl-tRNA synthetase
MECNVSFGELGRMTQFKDKSAKRGADFISAGLFTYPALQAADILLYDTDEVPVGDDQRQHLELARDLAIRFNGRFGDTFVVPRHVIPPVGARVMDLQRPEAKMSKSLDSPQGTVGLLDDPKDIVRKFKRAVTDSDNEVRYDPATKPGVANLLSILAAVTDGDPEALAANYQQYGPLKADTAEAVVEALRPVRERNEELAKDPGVIDEVLATGAAKASAIASATMTRVRDRLGLPPLN